MAPHLLYRHRAEAVPTARTFHQSSRADQCCQQEALQPCHLGVAPHGSLRLLAEQVSCHPSMDQRTAWSRIKVQPDAGCKGTRLRGKGKTRRESEPMAAAVTHRGSLGEAQAWGTARWGQNLQSTPSALINSSILPLTLRHHRPASGPSVVVGGRCQCRQRMMGPIEEQEVRNGTPRGDRVGAGWLSRLSGTGA